MTHHNPAKMPQPRKQPLYFPTASIATKLTPILRLFPLPIPPMRGNHLYTLLRQCLIQRITVICPISNQTYWPGLGKTSRQSGFDQPGLMWRSTGHQHRQRHPIGIGYRHEFASFTSLCLAHTRPPFLAATKQASIKHSESLSLPCWWSSSANTCKMRWRVPFRFHAWKRSWQVDLGGKWAGSLAQGAPVWSIQRIASRISRSARRGRPRRSGRLGGETIRGSMRAHCASVSFMRPLRLSWRLQSIPIFRISSRK